MTKVVILGIDGGTWNLLQPLINKGYLPNLKSLLEKAVYGTLQSSIPPITAPAWVSFATGKNPGKHGIYDFIMPKNSITDLRTITSKDIKGKTFYEILDIMGYKSILINLPVSFPPRNSYITITSLLTKGKNFVFPTSLINDVPELKDYRIFPNANLAVKKDKKEYFEDIREMERVRFKVARSLFLKKSWDLFFLLFSGTDWVQHMAFNDLVSHTLPYNHPAFLLYKDLDYYIDFFLRNLPEDASLIILSDHGFRTYKGIVYINKILEDNNLLKIKESKKKEIHITEFEKEISKFKHKLKVRLPVRLWYFLKRHNLTRIIYFLERMSPIHFYLQGEADVLKTYAYYLTFESLGIYINSEKKFRNAPITDFDDFQHVNTKVINILKALMRENVIKEVWSDVELYTGKEIKRVPDFVFLPNDYWPSPLLLTDKDIVDAPLNHHDLNGIFIAYGPDIKKGEEIGNIKIYDLAPTILHMFSLPIPADMDGKVLNHIFDEKSVYNKRLSHYVLPEYYEKYRESHKIKAAIMKLRL